MRARCHFCRWVLMPRRLWQRVGRDGLLYTKRWWSCAECGAETEE